MSKAIMYALPPKQCGNIANGKQTIIVSKTIPKNLKPPFKVYIYCTYGGPSKTKFIGKDPLFKVIKDDMWQPVNGKVIGEFVCDKVIKFYGEALEMCYLGRKFHGLDLNEEFFNGSCMSYEEAHKYFNKENNFCAKSGYGWHISELKLYDKPKELGEFRKQNSCYNSGKIEKLGCWEKYCPIQELGECDGRYSVVTRPPQSWGYVEEQ